jgi:threonine dehydratase
MSIPLTPVPLAAIEAARTRLHGIALRTPLVRLGLPDASPQILLKLENLQPIGSFKLRGAANAMALAGRAATAIFGRLQALIGERDPAEQLKSGNNLATRALPVVAS